MRFQHGFGDALIGAATAEIAAHALAHPFRIVTRQAFLEQSDGAHDLARRAKAALQAVASNECLLYGMKAVALRYALDRQDLGAVETNCKREARIDPPSIDEHGAGAALAAIAALLGSCQIQPFAQQVKQRDTRVIERDDSRDAVDGESGGKVHAMLHMSDGEALPPTDFGDGQILRTGRRLCRRVALPDTKMLCVEIAASTDTEATSAFQGLDSADSQDRG